MTTIAVKIEGTAAVRRTLRRIDPKRRKSFYADLLHDLALRGAKIAAEDKIVRGGGGPPLPNRLTSRTGNLRRSIRAEGPSFGTDLVYGRVHELGLGRFPRRPFLAPAAQDVIREAPRVLANKIQREIDKP